jgi:AraC family transcriptional activator FtrA
MLRTLPAMTLRNVAAVVLPEASPFELGVICEVFGTDRTAQGITSFDFAVCSSTPGQPLPTKSGFEITAKYDWTRLREADLIAVSPSGPPAAGYDPLLLAELRAAVERGAWVMSLCSGAFVLGAAGILDNRRCTTHWMYADALVDAFPAAIVERDSLFVEDRKVITSAGTAAGIDACLHLVRSEIGTDMANRIARRMVVPPQRAGSVRQYVEAPLPDVTADTLEPILAWALEHLEQELSVRTLADRAHMSPRTFARRFVEETGDTPLQWILHQRVLHARRLLENSPFSVEDVATRCGFGTAAALRRHFARVLGTSPTSYRATFNVSISA